MKLINIEKLTLLQFTANWCSVCQAITPIIENVVKEFENIDYIKIDVEKNKDIAFEYGITSIPTLLFIKNGKLVDKHVGVITKTPLKNKIENYL